MTALRAAPGPRGKAGSAAERSTGTALALLQGTAPDAALATAWGYRDVAALERALYRRWQVDATGWQALGRTGRYRFAYGGPFHVEQTLRYLGRDADNLAERVEGATYRRHFPLGERQVPLRLTLHADGCEVALADDAATTLDAADKLTLHERLRHFLGLGQPLDAFYRAMRADAVMAPLTRRLRGVRIPQVPSLWEALCWAVIGQQINLAFAYRLRNRFIALGNGHDPATVAPATAGRPTADADPGRSRVAGAARPLPFPTPAQVLTIPAPAWREAQFSRQKAAYLTGVARAFVDGALSEAVLGAQPPEAVAETLQAVKGLGPWSVAYGLLRALGRMDALPVGDAGLRSALRHHYALPAPPDRPQQEALMEPFRPYRGLVTYYLWKSLDALRQE